MAERRSSCERETLLAGLALSRGIRGGSDARCSLTRSLLGLRMGELGLECAGELPEGVAMASGNEERLEERLW